ncbi:MAG TPA: RidA family protein [Anaerohalosphaeraceae bacterium]|jgi:2-iminobutanoate/2-iminopropanoate deaminase|nr:RidA family protein [Anaerohalosphaeraceae bacterium]HPB92154.1 RidA family protein [Anaerohalosphaeraceae bacterium]HRT22616.1 RidA family protein [Anaerohalosphaeraceae bacterium]HRU14481.1 RidA family protein [Anaerohalosphaeraceae bacterium]
MRKAISTEKAPRSLGPYSQAIQVGQTLYLSGQLGIEPSSGKLAEGGTAAQARQALLNIQALVSAAGFSMQEIVQVQIFLADMNDFTAVNEVYRTFFQEPFPARAAVQVSGLPSGGRIEILAVAQKEAPIMNVQRRYSSVVRRTEHPYAEEYF